MIDNAKINALIQKYGRVAAGRKIDYQPVRLEQAEFLSTYRTEEDRILTSRTDAPNADSFKKRKPSGNSSKVVAQRHDELPAKKQIARVLEAPVAHNDKVKANKKAPLDSQRSHQNNASKTGKPVKKKAPVVSTTKERDSKISRLLDAPKQPRQKKSESLTPEKSARNRKNSTTAFLKKQFERIDKRLDEYRIQTCEAANAFGSNDAARRQPNRETLPSRLSLNKVKPTTRNQRATTMRSIDRPRSSTYRSTTRSITGRTKPTQQDESTSFRKKSKNPRKTSSKLIRPKKDIPSDPADLLQARRTRRRIVTEIQTEYTDDKRSYFDEEVYNRLVAQQQQIEEAEEGSALSEERVNEAAAIIQRAWRAYREKKQQRMYKETTDAVNEQKLRKRLKISTFPHNDFASGSSRRTNSPIDDEIFRSGREDNSREREVELERFRMTEHEKWDRMYRNLMQIQANLGENEIKKQLPVFIQMCEQNRRQVENIELTVRSRELSSSDHQSGRPNEHALFNAGQSNFEQRRKQYDDAPLSQKLSRKKKSVDEISQKSIQREVSSKKLVDEVQNFCLNDQLTEQLSAAQSRPHQSPANLVEEQEHHSQTTAAQLISTSDYLTDARSDLRLKKKLDFQEGEPQMHGTHELVAIKSQKSDDNFQQFLQLVRVDTFFQARPDLNGVVDWLMEVLAKEFASDLFNSKEILHRLLTARDELSINVKEYAADRNDGSPEVIDAEAQAPIQCNETFVLALVKLFMLDIEENHKQNFDSKISVPFGEPALSVLKFYRTSCSSEDGSDELDASNKYRTILEVEIFIEFEPVLKERLLIQSTVSQYFFNHCVFDCLNELLDRFRPYGMRGRPPLCTDTVFKAEPFPVIMAGLMKALKSITEMEVGKLLYEGAEVDEVSRGIEESFRRLDQSGIEETSHEWKDNSDLQFEVVLELSFAVVDHLLFESAFELNNMFWRE